MEPNNQRQCFNFLRIDSSFDYLEISILLDVKIITLLQVEMDIFITLIRNNFSSKIYVHDLIEPMGKIH